MMAASHMCTHFTQNTWKKDLCSNCFKSKDEHKQTSANMTSSIIKYNSVTATNISSSGNLPTKYDYPNQHKTPSKSIIRKTRNKNKSNKVSFPKNLSEIIGYGGERSENSDDDNGFMNLANNGDDDEVLNSDDEESAELKRLTKVNTDFNMHNANFLNDPKDNIKKTYTALKLGAPQVDNDGNKRTLQINVTPFGSNVDLKQTSTPVSGKNKYELRTTETKFDAEKISKASPKQAAPLFTTALINSKTLDNCLPLSSASPSLGVTINHTSPPNSSSTPSDSDGTNSPPIERAMEKSLLDEISETLEHKKNQLQHCQNSLNKVREPSAVSPRLNSTPRKIKFEITSLAETMENKTLLDIKRGIVRNTPIVKDQMKPTVNVLNKYLDTERGGSDSENGMLNYDVVESQISYENIPDGKFSKKSDAISLDSGKTKQKKEVPNPVHTSSQYLTDMLLSSKTRAASYNLHEGNLMTSKIMSDGLVITKCVSEDTLDSTASSIDGSSDEEASYNMIRSESDSGIGISLSNDCKALSMLDESKRNQEKFVGRPTKERRKKVISKNSNNINSDYEVIDIVENGPIEIIRENDITEKSRELHGEPDGSADPDGSLERTQESDSLKPPALPKSLPPEVIDARPSFLHGVPQLTASSFSKKPDLPAKPHIMKRSERQQQQIITPKMCDDTLNSTIDSIKDDSKLKKAKAPNPPNVISDQGNKTESKGDIIIPNENQTTTQYKGISTNIKKASITDPNIDTEKYSSNRYMCKLSNIGKNNFVSNNCGTVSKAMAAQVLKEKEKTERNIMNTKFRSLNTFATQRSNAIRNLELQNVELASTARITQPLSELTSKNTKALSMSEECLTEMPTSPTSVANSMSITNLSAAVISGEKKSSTKSKAIFSIKKFLRMGKTAENFSSNKLKKGRIYSEICTGEEANISGKPRLVIIHPIDINPTAVEVVKDINQTNDNVVTQTAPECISSKPPAPPLRSSDNQRNQEINKPCRPPPPKSAELRRKQKIASICTSSTLQHTTTNDISVTSTNLAMPTRCDTIKTKPDNAYANLGEIRSSIAPRKPERTASMREREAQLELARKRHMEDTGKENCDSISICSSANNDNILTTGQIMNTSNISSKNSPHVGNKVINNKLITVNDINNHRNGESFEEVWKKNEAKIVLSKKLEIFDNNIHSCVELGKNDEINVDGNNRSSGLKDSVRKITSTIDNYLKDKRDYENLYECLKNTVPSTPCTAIEMRFNQQKANKRNNLSSDTISLSSYTRSDYGPVRPSGLNNCLVNVPRLTSASYCGSESGDFDIYSPYSYYSSEPGGDVNADINDALWGLSSAGKNRTKGGNRLRMRKGRSVVHKSIEDNYSAVVSANHEALAQVLEQLQQTPIVPLALRPLAHVQNLRFEDFTILEDGHAFVVGKKAFHSAIWSATPVTLALSADCNQLAGVGGELNQLSGGISGVLNPITEFCDLVPSYHLPVMPLTEFSLLQATISVLPRLQLDTLQSIGSLLNEKTQILNKNNSNFRGSIPNLVILKENNMSVLRNGTSVQNLATLNEESTDVLHEEVDSRDFNDNPINANSTITAFDDITTREVAFIMLQLINGMKNLQMKGIEEMPLSLSNVVLSKEIDNTDAQARLCVLQDNCNNEEDGSMGSLCKCAYTALNELLPITKITGVVSDILKQERSESLSKAKSVLEFILWGPSDVALAGTAKERELALQRWLDLERATVLHGLVRSRVELTVYDECHLMFLVRSTAKVMNDAATLLEVQLHSHSTVPVTTLPIAE